MPVPDAARLLPKTCSTSRSANTLASLNDRCAAQRTVTTLPRSDDFAVPQRGSPFNFSQATPLWVHLPLYPSRLFNTRVTLNVHSAATPCNGVCSTIKRAICTREHMVTSVTHTQCGVCAIKHHHTPSRRFSSIPLSCCILDAAMHAYRQDA